MEVLTTCRESIIRISVGINDGKKCYANSIEMHQDQTFTSKNILYFILEIGAGEGGGEVASPNLPPHVP